jgi:hypothetical protein
MEASRTLSWLYDVVKLFLQLMGVVCCSIPGAIAYFAVLEIGFSDPVPMLASLIVGFSCAYLVWTVLGRKLALIRTDNRRRATAGQINANTVDRANNPYKGWDPIEKIAAAVTLLAIAFVILFRNHLDMF